MVNLTQDARAVVTMALLFILLGTHPVASAQATEDKSGHTNVENQIQSQVTRAIEQEVKHAAAQHHWPPAQPDISLRLPSGSQRLEACYTPLDIERIDRRRYPAGRLRFSARCSQTEPWQITVQADVGITIPVAFAAKTLSKDAVITDNDIVLKPTDIATINREFFASKQGYIGLRALRQIRRDQQLSPSHLSPAYMVSAGDTVIIQASNGQFSANMQGVALEGGYEEQQIRVRNNSSGKVIQATIARTGLVTTLF
ncbi:flagella basal body P-ring formation protein FlgA [Photobacterium rosenbergii]|uniref:Flagella basal body P-ring formation protein FlgA n=1 Tax=Photobacterium rosenbergii TaxID=294936 RepID=A0A2T3N6Q1_9GAMM|nr:flagellar basal body P-ring formation chaperone FlgA [Photobacterium rosenbergii]PSW08436.1 flagella basal body P-ring formation protein FlgA [Photobacterium rosenbergii]